MPQVPILTAPQVQQHAAPQVRMATPQYVRPNYNQIHAGTFQQQDQAGQISNAMGRLGAGMGQIAEAMQKEQDEADLIRVNDALNSAKERELDLIYGSGKDGQEQGFTGLKGRAAMDRPEEKPLADEFTEKFQKTVDELSSGLGNDRQRELFLRHAMDIKMSLYGKALSHESNEARNYALSVSEGVQMTAQRDITLNWNNPGVVQSAVERINAETYRQAKLLGKSAEWQQATARTLTSGAHKLAAMTALENGDPVYAKAYMNKFAKQMDADDLISVQKVLTKEVDIRVAINAAADAYQSKPMQVGDASRAFNILIDAESGGSQFDEKGKPLTSPKGAIGIAQVMPKTAPEAAKLAGLEWDEEKYKTDEAYNKALGMAYFQKQLQDFGGDLSKAYAAYNAGPGALQEAIKKADKDGKHWLSYLPEETRNYVTKNMAAFDSGKGDVEIPTLEELDKALMSDPRIANNPERLKMARAELARRYKLQTDAIKQRDDKAYAEALKGLLENGGDLAGLPSAVRSRVPAEKRIKLMEDADKISKGDDSTNEWLYNHLESNPEQLKAMSDDEFLSLRTSLSQSDFKYFSKERAKLRNPEGVKNDAGDLNSQAIKTGLDNRLRMIGVDPSPSKKDTKDAARIGAIRQFVNQTFLAMQQNAGKKFTDQEIESSLDALFLKNADLKGFFKEYTQPMLSMKDPDDIPKDIKNGLKAAFKRAGNNDPTDAQMLRAYWNMQVFKK